MQRQRRSVEPSYFSCERVEARFRLQGGSLVRQAIAHPLASRILNIYLLLVILLLSVY